MKMSFYVWILGSLVMMSACGNSSSKQQAAGNGAKSPSEVTLNPPIKDDRNRGEGFTDLDQGFDRQDTDNRRVTPEVEESCYKGDAFLCEVEAAIVRQTNELRAPAQPFKQSAKIGYVARLWSESMSNVGFISHWGFPRSRVSDYADEFGQSASLSAENVAMNYSNSQNAEDVAQAFTDMWWNSSGHRRNMKGNFAELGVGVYKSGSRYYATQLFGRE